MYKFIEKYLVFYIQFWKWGMGYNFASYLSLIFNIGAVLVGLFMLYSV
jgi:miniconductance mechanosensitive channel